MINQNFALYVLWKNKNDIFVDGKGISKPSKSFPEEFTKPLIEGWEVGKELSEKQTKIENIGLDDLKSKGKTVVIKFIEGKRALGIYEIRIDYGHGNYEAAQDQLRGYQIQFNSGSNMVRLTGPYAFRVENNKKIFGSTDWVRIQRLYEKKIKKDEYGRPIIERGSYMKTIYRRYGKIIEEKPEYFKINQEHLPVMITNDGKILCMPKKHDMQKIGFAGKTGYGKSIAMHSIMDRVYHNWGDNIIVLNDSLNQFHSLHQKTDFFKLPFLLDYEKGEIEKGMPLPILNLYLACPIIKHNWKNIDFNYYVSIYEYLNKFGYFTNGIEKYKIKGTERYVSKLKDIAKCKTKEEVEEVAFREFGEKYNQMITKLVSTFEGIFQEKFLDHLYDSKAEWADKSGYKGDPIFVCIRNRIIPILNTSFAKLSPSFKNIMGNITRKIIKYQQEYESRTWVVVDEIPDIYKVGKRSDNASEAIEELFRQGRIHNIGFGYTIQSYDDLHDDIRSNTSHLFTSFIKTGGERRLIKKDYGLSDEMEKKLGKMNKFEFICCTDEKMFTYDKKGDIEEYNGGTFVGTCLAPWSKHIAPKRDTMDTEEVDK